VQQWVDAFECITVICEKTDGFLAGQIQIVYSGLSKLRQALTTVDLQNAIGYGDFYIAEAFIDAGIPYYVTYHDNWPELALQPSIAVDVATNQQSGYAKLFRNAERGFSVTEYKGPYINQHTSRVSVVRNGLSQSITKRAPLAFGANRKLSVLMAGNISERKYFYALEIFKGIPSNLADQIEIDIFGHPSDTDIVSQFDKYSFVNYRGFTSELSYKDYDLYINTSTIENLSLSVVDAIANCTPVLAFDIGGLHEVITKGSGILVSPFDAKEFVQAIADVANGDFIFDQSTVDLKKFNWAESSSSMLDFMTTTSTTSKPGIA